MTAQVDRPGQFCASCGAGLPPGSRFCQACGSATGAGSPGETDTGPSSTLVAPDVGPVSATGQGSAGMPSNPFAAPPTFAPAPGYPPSGYGAGYGFGPQPTNPGTNGMAVASLVLGIVWIYWIGSVLALVFGYVAVNQIKTATRAGQPPQSGRGMAIAGTVLGWVGVAFLVLVVIGIAIASHSSTRY